MSVDFDSVVVRSERSGTDIRVMYGNIAEVRSLNASDQPDRVRMDRKLPSLVPFLVIVAIVAVGMFVSTGPRRRLSSCEARHQSSSERWKSR